MASLFLRVPNFLYFVFLLGALSFTTVIAFYEPLRLTLVSLVDSQWHFLLHQRTLQWISCLAWAVHLAEAAIAVKLLTQDLGKSSMAEVVFWGVQTFLLGFPSLKLLQDEVVKRQGDKKA